MSDSTPVSPLSFLEKISTDFPQFSFRPGKKFLFRPKKMIYYVPPEDASSFPLLLLHELSHALLGHYTFSKGSERLKMERDAWKKTEDLCKTYGIPFDPSLAEENLDTYRAWLYKKTLCPVCSSTCAEIDTDTLFCPLCEKKFKR